MLFTLEQNCNNNSGVNGQLLQVRIHQTYVKTTILSNVSSFSNHTYGDTLGYLNMEEEKDYVYVFTNGATHGYTLRCYDVSSGTPTVLFEEIINGGYITWTNNFYVGINGTNQRYHADAPTSFGHMNYDYKQFDIVWQEMSDTEIVSYLAANHVTTSIGESVVVSTSLHTDVLAEEGTYANLSVGMLSEALPDASVVRFNDLTNTERFEVSFRNWAELDNSPTTISLDPGLEGDVLAVSCAEGFTLDGQADGPTSFNLTCELRNGVLQWVQNHSACYFIGTELPTYEIDFSAYIDKTVEFAQADLTANFPSLSPQFLVGSTQVQATNSNSNFQHHLTNPAYTPDPGGINFWDYEPTNPAAALGTFKLTADAIGKFTIVYGCLIPANNNESVKIYVNGFLHSETTSTSATVTINVSKNDVIEIQESQAVIALYSITFVQH